MADIHLTAAEAKLVGVIIEEMGEINWETIATKADYDDKKKARNKWYPIRDKLVVAGGGVAKLGSKKRANGDVGDGDNGTPPTSAKKPKATKKTPHKAKGMAGANAASDEEDTPAPKSTTSKERGKKNADEDIDGGDGAVKAEIEVGEDGWA